MIFFKHLGIDVAFKIFVNQRLKGWDSYFEVNISKLLKTAPLPFIKQYMYTRLALENDIYNT